MKFVFDKFLISKDLRILTNHWHTRYTAQVNTYVINRISFRMLRSQEEGLWENIGRLSCLNIFLCPFIPPHQNSCLSSRRKNWAGPRPRECRQLVSEWDLQDGRKPIWEKKYLSIGLCGLKPCFISWLCNPLLGNSLGKHSKMYQCINYHTVLK